VRFDLVVAFCRAPRRQLDLAFSRLSPFTADPLSAATTISSGRICEHMRMSARSSKLRLKLIRVSMRWQRPTARRFSFRRRTGSTAARRPGAVATCPPRPPVLFSAASSSVRTRHSTTGRAVRLGSVATCPSTRVRRRASRIGCGNGKRRRRRQVASQLEARPVSCRSCLAGHGAPLAATVPMCRPRVFGGNRRSEIRSSDSSLDAGTIDLLLIFFVFDA